MSQNFAHFIEFSKPFIDATKNVFETMVSTKINAQKPSIKTSCILNGEISAVIGLSGEVTKDGQTKSYKAMLVMSFPYSTYFKIASTILNENYTSYVPEIRDVGGEIVNMVMGNAKRDLRAVGYTSNMAIPSMIEGKDHTIKYPDDTTIVLIPVQCSHGEFYIELCYVDGD